MNASEWQRFYTQVRDANRDPKSGDQVIETLMATYARQPAADKAEINQVLSEDLESDDSLTRYDAHLVISMFEISTALPALERVASRLAGSRSVPERGEAETIRATIARLRGTGD
ncbi:MAG TPA: hypothetical protein VL294_06920 [Pseudolysinimonas sp.]|jgi:hypothetical protein|nr:hypothetical protein [Pseudolysinimonas sp.]